jgi:death-on-curing protein
VIWLTKDLVLLIHDGLLAKYGGLPGILNEGALEATLARPRHLLAYGKKPDLAALAGAYAFGLACKHAFADGNKRTSLLGTMIFLARNEAVLLSNERELVETWERLGAGKMSETDISAWIRARLTNPSLGNPPPPARDASKKRG